jgi:hypothetical protein
MIAFFLAKCGIRANLNCIDIVKSYESQAHKRWKKLENLLTEDERGKFGCY